MQSLPVNIALIVIHFHLFHSRSFQLWLWLKMGHKPSYFRKLHCFSCYLIFQTLLHQVALIAKINRMEPPSPPPKKKKMLENSECLLVLYLCFEGCPPPFLFIIHLIQHTAWRLAIFPDFTTSTPIKYNPSNISIEMDKKYINPKRCHVIIPLVIQKHIPPVIYLFIWIFFQIFLVENCVSWRMGAMDQI